MKKVLSDWKIALLASLTLGLAPFTEPHIWGKLMWIKGGAVGMKGMDWLDTFLHGLPWIWLIVATSLTLKNKMTAKN